MKSKKKKTPDLEKTPVSDLSIADVLKMPVFVENMKSQIKLIWDDREKARAEAKKKGDRLRHHVIDELNERGLLDEGRFTILFAQVLNKVASGYSAIERGFIRDLGMIAFKITMKNIIEDEKKGNNGDRDNKQ